MAIARVENLEQLIKYSQPRPRIDRLRDFSVPTKGGDIVIFEPFPAQRYVLENITGHDNILKARQVGITTLIMLIFLDELRRHPGRRAHTLLHKQELEPELRDRFETAAESAGIYLRIQRTGLWELPNGSQYRISTIGGKTAVIGSAVQYLHFTEMAEWDPPDLAHQQSVKAIRAVPRHIPGNMIFMESTAGMMGGHWWNEWQKAEKTELRKNILVPWFMSPDYDYAKIPENETVPPMGYWLARPESTRVEWLKSEFGITDSQRAWRDWQIEEIGDEDEFLSQYAEDSVSCWFNPEGLFLDTMVLKSYLDAGLPPPLHRPEDFMWIWEDPNAHKQDVYVMGVDAASGSLDSGASNSAAFLMNAVTGEQAAEIYGRLEPTEFAFHIMALSVLFNNAIICVEFERYGESVVEEIHKHMQETGNWINLYYSDPEGKKPGWWPHGAGSRGRGALLHSLRRAFKMRRLKPKSPNFFKEAGSFSRKDRPRIAEAASGTHDDLIMAAMYSWAMMDWADDELHPGPTQVIRPLIP